MDYLESIKQWSANIPVRSLRNAPGGPGPGAEPGVDWVCAGEVHVFNCRDGVIVYEEVPAEYYDRFPEPIFPPVATPPTKPRTRVSKRRVTGLKLGRKFSITKHKELFVLGTPVTSNQSPKSGFPDSGGNCNPLENENSKPESTGLLADSMTESSNKGSGNAAKSATEQATPGKMKQSTKSTTKDSANKTASSKSAEKHVTKTGTEPVNNIAGAAVDKSADKPVHPKKANAMDSEKPAAKIAGQNQKNAQPSAATQENMSSQEVIVAAIKSGMNLNAKNKSSKKDWERIWQIIAANPRMIDDAQNIAYFKSMIAQIKRREDSATGPVCANPECQQPGHTIAVCPGPVHKCHGDMLGCFFCNTYDHDADDCAMMETVTVPALITHLITNRAGLPPWSTRVDWVALASTNYDLVDMTSLPLTRDFVKQWYIPQQVWKHHATWIGGRSPFSDPLLVGADRAKLKKLAHPGPAKKSRDCGTPRCLNRCCRPYPLMEAAMDGCYGDCETGILRAVHKNPELRKYIPNCASAHHPGGGGGGGAAGASGCSSHGHAHNGAAAADPMMGLRAPKQQPKSVNKVRMGRRAMKKAMMEEEKKKKEVVEGEGNVKKGEENGVEEAAETDSEDELPVSERPPILADRVDKTFNDLRAMVQS
ncbi:hypothetical protein VTK56DRAFT_4431 [Thermocarpiscus australiensis]